MSIRETIARSLELQRESNRAGIVFFKTELDVSLTFVQLALQAKDDPEKRVRNQANARKGYDTLIHLLGRLPLKELAEADRELMEERLTRLRAALDQLGESI